MSDKHLSTQFDAELASISTRVLEMGGLAESQVARAIHALVNTDGETASQVLRNAVAWFAERGVTVHRVLSDNGSCYRSRLWHQTCDDLGITAKKIRPYRPQTNGKIERFHRTLADGWAFKTFYPSEADRLAALPGWIHQYNHHRPHSAIGKVAPITRLDNLAGHHS